MTKSKITISIEQAEAELLNLLEAMDIDTDVDSMLPDNAEGFKNTLRNLAVPITKGKAIIDGNSYILTLKNPLGDEKTLTISEPNGSAWDAMQAAGKKDNGTKGVMLFSATMVKIPYAQLVKLPASDFKVIKEFALLFLA